MAFWQDLPNETTPRNSENLSRSERYLTATAGLNGDFYVEIDGASGLATGDVIRISFPEATSGTADARLSLDGGTTYKDIKLLRGSNNIPASLVENKDETLKYDGTRFIVETSLVAYYKFTSASTSSGAISVDLNADGGSYELEFTGASSASSAYWLLYNGITSDANYENQRLYFRDTTVDTSASSGALAGFMYNASSYNLHNITMPMGFPTSIQTNAIRNASNFEGLYYIQTYKVAQTNITSITITMISTPTISTNSEIKIYKKGK